MTTATQDRIGATILPVRTPMRTDAPPVETAEDESQGSFWLRLSGRWQRASSLDNLWEISEAWWDGRPVIKMYFRVTTEDQSQLIIFRDLLSGAWYREGPDEEEVEEGVYGPANHSGILTNQQAAQKTAKINYRAA